DWDADGPRLRENRARVLSYIRKDAFGRAKRTIEAARTWHRDMMHRLDAPNSEYVGRYRGEPGIEHCEVRIGHDYCVRSNDVAASLIQLEQTLQDAVEALDQIIQPNQDISADQLDAVIELSDWVHSDWVLILSF